MAAEAVASPGKWQSAVAFLKDSVHEIRFKTTWPDYKQVQQASIAIIIFVLIVGMLITLLDLALNGVFVRLLPSLFS